MVTQDCTSLSLLLSSTSTVLSVIFVGIALLPDPGKSQNLFHTELQFSYSLV